MQITIHTHSPRLARKKIKLRMTLDCSRRAKETALVSEIIVKGTRPTILYSCK